ncbi:MAG: FecR domain-containing protein [Candidatus Koribacter versatilis]|uniref:FecR domain-containing protein n=1 Tax=Candidatus Korobacter versatilis TaxID=658062 RepID=A0A932A9J4_9BACT|nr:FecR domain-containing protein [Candidatus Koribacter versatilis]
MPPIKQQQPGIHIQWTTITYRSVLLAILALVALVGVVMYFAFPEPTKAGMDKVGSWISPIIDKWAGKADKKPGPKAGQQDAHFTNIDGTVKVKKANSNSWVTADYSLPLEKGDIIRTDSEGIAKIVFADGTNYTVKQDSLIVVEENSTNAAQQTQVAVQVTTGTVDLTTANLAAGSKSQVTVAGATAVFGPQSAAQVKNDARADSHEIMLTKGSGEVKRGTETVQLGSYEKVAFKNDSQFMSKSKEIGPPTLITPANMMPLFVSGKQTNVNFSWTPVDNVSGYHIRISKNPYFSSTVLDRRVSSTDVALNGLPEGAYYWVVTAMDGKGKESIESEKNRFTVIPKGSADVQLPLEIEFQQQAHIIIIQGKTEPAARVMVNGQEVPTVQEDGSFIYYTPPLPTGESVITVTAQNAKGGVATQTKRVIIQ